PVILSESPFAKILVMTGFGTIDLAVDAMEKGATTFLTKSDDPMKIVAELEARLESPEPPAPHTTSSVARELGIVGQSPKIRSIIDEVGSLRAVVANVLILGEAGTGKEPVARAIHLLAVRRQGSFEAVTCGAIPETLLESELFGYRKGA